jgi:hypothetical protein
MCPAGPARILGMEQNPYESPQADQEKKPLTDGKSTAKHTATVQPEWDVGFAPSFSAAVLVAAAFIYAIQMTLKRSRRG